MFDKIIYSPLRSKRPVNRVEETITDEKLCPFCIHNEHMTTKPVYVSDDKEIRIVPNKYPVVSVDSENYGYSDVVIDTKNHTETLAEYSLEHLEKVLKVIRDRVIYLYKDDRIKYVQVFKNQGLLAGASQSHSHWQIIALDKLPLNKSVNGNEYKIEENEYFMSCVLENNIFDYSISLKSVYGLKDFRDIQDREIHYLAKILKSSVTILTELTGRMYNICFYDNDFRVDIIPRMGTFAGFEISTGYFIKAVSPQKVQSDYVNKLKEINSKSECEN